MATLDDVLNFNPAYIQDADHSVLFSEAQNQIRLLQGKYTEYIRIADDWKQSCASEQNAHSDTLIELKHVRELLNQRNAELANAKDRANDDTTTLIRKMIHDHILSVLASDSLTISIDNLLQERAAEIILNSTDIRGRIEMSVGAYIDNYTDTKDFDDTVKDKAQSVLDDMRFEVN